VSHRQIRYIARPDVIRPLDRKTREQIRVDRRTSCRDAGPWPAVQRLNAHPAHQRRHVSSADPMTFPPQPVRKLAGAVERQLQVQLVDPPHQPQIPLRQRPRHVVHARAAESQKLRLAPHRHLSTPLNHRLPLRPGNFPSARPKTIWPFLIPSRDLSRRYRHEN